MIDELIDKQDGFEIVRDSIAAILLAEVINQKALAGPAGKDPKDFDLRIFTERANPWEFWLNDSVDTPVDRRPIINVWFDNENFDMARGGTVNQQQAEGTFNIDCYGYGKSADVPAGGHKAGDKEAALEVQRTVRLARNILMAATYTYLNLRGIVGQRWPNSIQMFQPEIDGRTVQQVVGARFALSVRYNETSPQVVGEILETINVKFLRTEDGEIVIEAEYDKT